MAADIAVEPFQLLVSETEIGFAHRQQIGALIGIAVPAAESEIGIEGGAFAIHALRIHEHTDDQQRVASPFLPEAYRAGEGRGGKELVSTVKFGGAEVQ